MKKINWKLIITIVVITLVMAGLYIGDYFWVENYKDVPVQLQHIFGHDLAKYIIYDHIFTGVAVGLITGVLIFTSIIYLKKK